MEAIDERGCSSSRRLRSGLAVSVRACQLLSPVCAMAPMLRLYVPVAVTVVIIGALTAWEGVYSDRFRGSSVTAAEFGERFKDLPLTVGPWVGEDNPVDEKTLEVAGAVNHVARVYRNTETQKRVDLWLVVGHSRDICRHTPDVCYIAQGFSRDGNMQKHRIEVEGE